MKLNIAELNEIKILLQDNIKHIDFFNTKFTFINNIIGKINEKIFNIMKSMDIEISKTDNADLQQLNIAGVSVSTLIQERKQWYLDNEYKEFKSEIPPFIQLKLDTDLRRDMTILTWLYSR